MTTNIDKLFDELYPICRSITGEGINKSLKIISNSLPIKIYSVRSGKRVFDWTVPKEWKLNRAYLANENGKIIIDSNINNLHVLNFSQPFRGVLSYKDLSKHIHTIKDLPNAIPYVTSYYKKNWGLCMSYRQFKKLKKNTKYKVHIDTKISNGFLRYGTFDLKGESKKLVMLSSYLCHPSMANNELSGPLTMIRLYEKLKSLKKRKFTYRFILLPETIGSITYLHKHGSSLIKNIEGGMVLTCLGGPSKKISFKLSRRDWIGNESKFDKIAKHYAKYESNNFTTRPFTPTGGSDERQYCSPGFNLPVIQAAKTVYPPYGNFPQYHTSMDNKSFMKISSVEKSANQIFSFLQTVEITSKKLKGRVQNCEPQLSKKNLYPAINSHDTRKKSNNEKIDNRNQLNIILSLLSLADGKRDIVDISNFLKISVNKLKPIIELLEKNKLL